MGEIIVRKVRGMNWKAKIGLVLVFTLFFSTFMYHGWYKPRKSLAATRSAQSYYLMYNTTENVGADGTCNMLSPTTNQNNIPVRGTMVASPSTATNFRTSQSAGSYEYIYGYTPAYTANDVIISNASFTCAVRLNNAANTMTFELYDYNPSTGAMTQIGESGVLTVGATNTTTLSGSYTIMNGGLVPQNHRVKLVIATTKASAGQDRVYHGGTTSTSGCWVTYDETDVATQIGNGKNPSNANAPRNTTNNALDSFTMQQLGGSSGSVDTITITGNANFNTTNIPTNGVHIYRDVIPLGVLDGADVLLNTTSPAINNGTNTTTVTLTSAETVNGTPGNYLVTVDINNGATLTNTINGTVSAITGSGLLALKDYGDSASATLTVTAAQTLTLGQGTDPSSPADAPMLTTNALDAFTLSLNTGTGRVFTFTVTGDANFNSTNIPTNGVKIWRDAVPLGTLDAGDTLISSGSTAISSNVTTVTLSSPENVSTSSANYLVTVDISGGAVWHQTFTGTISGATGTGISSVTDNDTSSAQLRITGRPATITSCGTCHTYPPTDGTRSGATGAVSGSHGSHDVVCSTCHNAPASEGASDYKHRNGYIQMKTQSGWSTGISGGFYDKAGTGTYSAAGDDSFAQANTPTLRTCRNVSCHGGNGTASPQWGNGTEDCVSCHSSSLAKSKGTTGTIRQIVGTGGDFDMATTPSGSSRHLFGATTIVKWDCVVCHMEGQYSGSKAGHVDWTDHNDSGGVVNLRNVDNPSTGWTVNNRTWTTTDYTNLDTFCLSCHDSDGASGINVNDTNSGLNLDNTNALRPFNSTDVVGGGLKGSTEFAGAARQRVTNVKSQFFAGNGGTQGLAGGSGPTWTTGGTYNGNPSQHAVIGQRYGTINGGWTYAAWVTNYGLKKYGKNLGVDREKSILSCADCHVLDSGSGAHGGTAQYNLAYSSVRPLCIKCHNTNVYVSGSTVSRWNHNYTRAGGAFGLNSESGPPNCLTCHASWDATSTATKQDTYGGIHGSWSSTATYTNSTGSAITAYRFFPGAYRKGTNYSNDNQWASTTGVNCYFYSSSDKFATCSSHDGTTTGTVTPNYSRPAKY